MDDCGKLTVGDCRLGPAAGGPVFRELFFSTSLPERKNKSMDSGPDNRVLRLSRNPLFEDFGGSDSVKGNRQGSLSRGTKFLNIHGACIFM
jgi:hypothetical protein